jgi:dGTPase
MNPEKMSWAQLLDSTRVRELIDKKGSVKASDESRSEFERDRDRAVYSSPVRRLIGKTQVFPLDPNDHVRTRLVHSLEVSTVAEGLASQVARDVISKKEQLTDDKLRWISKIAETCGLLHDLGNPPFGHAGELAIGSWFETKRELDKLKGTPKEPFFLPLGGPETQKAMDFLRFEGNAQTMRIVTNTHLLGHDYGLNLTCATTAAARKYLASSLTADNKAANHARTKPGHFLSEQQLLDRVAEQTGTTERRHPITFLVEAADDIVYSVVDIEDGIKKRILNWEQVKQSLDVSCKDSSVFDEAMKRTREQVQSSSPSDGAWAQAFRVNAISGTVRAAVHTFEHRYDEIMSGNYSEELVRDEHYEGASLIRSCKELLAKTVFREDDVLRLEVRGRRVLHDLLDLFWEGVVDFLDRREESTKTYAGKLYLLIAGSYRALFERRIEAAPDDAVYAGLQLVTDYVSGMTDGYACRLHKDLMNG